MARGFSFENWFPTLVLKLSVVVHALGLLALIPFPRAWPFLLGTMVAIHLALLVICMIPKSGFCGAASDGTDYRKNRYDYDKLPIHHIHSLPSIIHIPRIPHRCSRLNQYLQQYI